MNIYIKNFLSNFYIKYIEFVYKTSHIENLSSRAFPDMFKDEKYLITFWHGASYCFYPLLKNSKVFVFTTINERGDYISNISKHFGYTPVRVPDTTAGDVFFKIKKQITDNNDYHLVMTMDGPRGPYHEIKDFPLILALAAKRKIIPVSINVKYKIQLNNRWDKYMIPLPFNSIQIFADLPISLSKEDLREAFATKKNILLESLEKLKELKYVKADLLKKTDFFDKFHNK